jgi:hypothetical protein
MLQVGKKIGRKIMKKIAEGSENSQTEAAGRDVPPRASSTSTAEV